LIDYWSVHTSETFLTWLKNTHPLVKTIFVLANCTSVFQPTDVILQRPFKHAFRNEFDEWSLDQISQQLEDSTESKEIKLQTKLSILKPLICLWLYNAWLHIHKKKMIQIGWEKCELLQPFQADFQAASLDANISSPLFKENAQVEHTTNKEDLVEDIEPDTSIDAVMQDSLKNLVEVTGLQASGARISTIKGAAKKR
jgi:hypothetical protein